MQGSTIKLDRALMLLTGLSISCVAAWYSIIGLTTIFAGAYIAIIILGSVLELAKIILAAWLYRNWKYVSLLLKTYFTSAILILMLITSMGIFGLLSKAHLDQTLSLGEIRAKLERIDNSIERERQIQIRSSEQLAQLDRAINSIIDNNNRAQTALNIRNQQKRERDVISKTTLDSQKELDSLLDQRLPLASTMRNARNEVGPIRYIAELIFGQDSEEHQDRAVRWMIILLVMVIDPLAVLLIVASSRDVEHDYLMKFAQETNSVKYNNTDFEEFTGAVDGQSWRDISGVTVRKKSIDKS